MDEGDLGQLQTFLLRNFTGSGKTGLTPREHKMSCTEGKNLSLGNPSSSRDGYDPSSLEHVQLQQMQAFLQHLPETHISPVRFADVRL